MSYRLYVDDHDVTDSSTRTVTTDSTNGWGTWTATGPWTTVTTTSGTWTGTDYGEMPPDMADWPPEDIIDWHAMQLAKKHPA